MNTDDREVLGGFLLWSGAAFVVGGAVAGLMYAIITAIDMYGVMGGVVLMFSLGLLAMGMALLLSR